MSAQQNLPDLRDTQTVCAFSRIKVGPKGEFPYWCVTHEKSCPNLDSFEPAPRCNAEHETLETYPCLEDKGHTTPHDDHMGARWINA